MFKKLLSGIMAIAVCVVGLSGCGESQTEETTSETTTEVTTAKYSEEELEQMAQNMPEIVFVMSHHYDNSNIVGYYVTNTGEIKLYDFRQIAPDETYEILDVYDRLEEAVCSEIKPSEYIKSKSESMYQEQSITSNHLETVSRDMLIQNYKKLLLVDTDSDYEITENIFNETQGYNSVYGIRSNKDEKKEIILLMSYEEYVFRRYDDYTIDLYNWIYYGECFPKIPEYDN
ncbi:MAG: hypothetical protein IJN43_07030 [Ruminococcus sp.]|nr:hypothetical protein [Ruminococcus sp.]